MIIGHLPAAYLVAKFARSRGATLPLATGFLVGGLVPDADMLWFFFVDGGQTHHHAFLTHRPILWVFVFLIGLLLRRDWMIGLGLGGLVHLLLDSVAGQIAWGWPFWDTTTTLIVVPATRSHWLLSFLSHWTFLVEIGLTIVAASVLAWSWRQGRIL